MAKTTPFTYNSGSTIPGTIQVGDLAIGVTEQDYSNNPGGKTWYMGPNEDLGYVFTYTADTHPGPGGSGNSNFGFYRTQDFTNSGFTAMTEFLSIKQGNPRLFDTIFSADTWLTTNGYWNSLGPTFFISTWTTTNSNESIELPYLVAGTYDGLIDWGDGIVEENSYVNRIHIYSTPGTYTIKISGSISDWNFSGVTTNKDNIESIVQWGNLRIGDSAGAFYQCTNLNLTSVVDVINLSGVTSLSNMFNGCTNLTNINRVEEWDVSNITNMNGMFKGATNFQGDVGNWDVSSVTTMIELFNNSQFNQPLSGWNVSNVLIMDSMFNGSGFDQPINNWDVSNLTSVIYMFAAGSSFNQPLGSWDVTSITRDGMAYMFGFNPNFDQDISTWCVSHIVSKPSGFDDSTNPSWTTEEKPNWGVTC